MLGDTLWVLGDTLSGFSSGEVRVQGLGLQGLGLRDAGFRIEGCRV